ncbi:hypothetical protein SCA6_017890 [Theobroma cacao]
MTLQRVERHAGAEKISKNLFFKPPMQEIGSFEACPSSNVNDQPDPPNSGTGTMDKALTMAEKSDGTAGNEAMNNVADKNSKNNSIKLPTRPATSQHGDENQSEHVGAGKDSKNYFSKPPTQGVSFMHGDDQLRTESGLGGQNE